MITIPFANRTSIPQIEESTSLTQRSDADGPIPVVTTDAQSGEVLMMGVMTPEALSLTIQTGEAHLWSRVRQCLWHKGATSGLAQRLVRTRSDDDQAAVWLRVDVAGGASCHAGYRSGFCRAMPVGGAGPLRFTESAKVFDPVAVYGDAPNPTVL